MPAYFAYFGYGHSGRLSPGAEAPAAVVHQYPVAPATAEAVVAAVREGRRECPLPSEAVGLADALAAGAYRQLAQLVSGPGAE